MITAGGFSVDRRQVVLDKPIKTLGLHATRIALHPEVVVQVTLNIARSEDEAERQARGEDVTVIKEEKIELETFDADAVFDEEALARQKDEGEARDPPTRPDARFGISSNWPGRGTDLLRLRRCNPAARCPAPAGRVAAI